MQRIVYPHCPVKLLKQWNIMNLIKLITVLIEVLLLDDLKVSVLIDTYFLLSLYGSPDLISFFLPYFDLIFFINISNTNVNMI
ncbi:unnamed protein product [Schistosoma mattheei]|uniref:Uncharacterized protein n=1 Tax=Schistosoma mattheei TaxID=31246 RepID=A0A183NYE4_9TREM|nr:unnamed protein product [Schistosoma mattheei]